MTVTDEALIEHLKQWSALVKRDYPQWINKEIAIDSAVNRIEALIAENEQLASLVRGWHYLAVGPDEMGDYYTHRQLIKASEPYASPALVALAGKAEQ